MKMSADSLHPLKQMTDIYVEESETTKTNSQKTLDSILNL